MNNTSRFLNFMYETRIGTQLLKIVLKTKADLIVVAFLKSHLSKIVIRGYAKKHSIDLSDQELIDFKSYSDFFLRERKDKLIDFNTEHLISPCDGWLSSYDINHESCFQIKGSEYKLSDIVDCENVAKKYIGGKCIVIRLCASDYHHYCYIDDCVQGESHYLEGELHSVQPVALSKYSVFTLNRRTWAILDTVNFGAVLQAEIGAMIVGGIANKHEGYNARRGDEKGCFELAGSTVVLMFEAGRIELLPEYDESNIDNEVRVKQGMWIGNRINPFRRMT